ncbi:benzoate utilization transcription regulator BenM [Acinetobacter ursingii]|uniref:LysR family transcriptional regulator n=1 Tax=Acinetobacter ursingii TaxID=108980 RepID=A0AA46S9H1_9GAMM|nr:benzoate utilization transcription regulator BenM [Acinetobacter ursingii]MCU4350309.1 LysR family transcriptional regulator [Acinetobacter ursingii]MCU4570055.1 LysR family transcriptional regulator [Acinetobacter ursingii]MCU4601777.1 LysR family transcriptional regulator [Acinetobacter ursingii]MDH2018524.1 benzoate utilization transcription regulator BenM [Acinetobacter ursingii]MDH2070815.1 benzoate utilization transcription regulator BenM [Acinetobacter ursingii]
MELRHLRYFVAVVEEQSFTKAADKLCIAQPPLSRQIQNLEEELGLQLLERGSRPVKTTSVGQFFYQYAVKLLSNADQMVSMTKRIASVETTIKIGFVGSLLFGLLPRIIYLYRQAHPNLKIELYEMGTNAQIEALKDGRIDVGFGRLKISDPAIKRTLLRNERLMVAVHASHPLNRMKDTGVHLADIVDERILLYPSTAKPNFSTHVLSIFSEHGLEPTKLNDVREVQLALGLVAAGEGICIVPESTTSIQLYNLSYVPLLDPDAISPIFIAARNMEESTYLYSMLETIRQIYAYEGFSNNALM